MSPARRALQRLQRELNGSTGTTFGHLPILECIETGHPYVVAVGDSCRYELPNALDVRADRFEFTVAGVALLRAELTGLGLLSNRPTERPLTHRSARAPKSPAPEPQDETDDDDHGNEGDDDEERTTFYLTTAGYKKAADRFHEMERYIDADIGLGCGSRHPYINVYSDDREVIDRVVEFLGASNVVVVPGWRGPSVWDLLRRPWPREDA